MNAQTVGHYLYTCHIPNPDGTGNQYFTVTLTVVSSALPMISGFSPTSGSPGSAIAIYGASFGSSVPAITVLIGGTPATVTGVGSNGTVITALVPHTNSGQLQVYVAGVPALPSPGLNTTFTVSAAQTITSNPQGLSVIVDGSACTTPCYFPWAANTVHNIGVVSPQSGATGTQYLFFNWSDSGGQSHQITVGSSSATYTANFITQYYLTHPRRQAKEGASARQADGTKRVRWPSPRRQIAATLSRISPGHSWQQ